MLSATHLPSRFNEEADEESPKNESHLEWMRNQQKFVQIIKEFGRYPEVDLFANWLNYQFKPFISFRPGPGCSAVNAFSISWEKAFFYAFPHSI